ncbi:unnamed protein product [Amoebophrya sp. A25]|nr:unnamed protein product [Amoebophrya sp. A25]|eukprot:GSA25T00010364001.1
MVVHTRNSGANAGALSSSSSSQKDNHGPYQHGGLYNGGHIPHGGSPHTASNGGSTYGSVGSPIGGANSMAVGNQYFTHVPSGPTKHSHVRETIEVLPGRLFWRAEPKHHMTTRSLAENAYHHPQGNYNFRLLNTPNEVGYRFESDLDICYQAFAKDFGPLNLAVIWRYCRLMEQVMEMDTKTVTHQCDTSDIIRMTNSVFLISAYCIVMEGKTANEMYNKFKHLREYWVPYRDASSCPSIFDLDMLSCLEGLEVGIKLGWFVYKDFDADEYEHYEKVESGDLNWIIPHKMLAFASPQNKSRDADGYLTWTPEGYSPLFKKWNINLVVRLNKATCYDREKFIKNGVKHLDLYFNDGGLPPMEHLYAFLHASETEKGGVAVHCKAGLGRTGTLIGAYVMKHYKVPARVFIAWNRLARPGSVLGPQQQFLCDIEPLMFSLPSHLPEVMAFRPGPGHPIRVNPNPALQAAIANNPSVSRTSVVEGSNVAGSREVSQQSPQNSKPTPAGSNKASQEEQTSSQSQQRNQSGGNKKFYGAGGNAKNSKKNPSTVDPNIEQQGQGEWLLSQKKRAQGMKTSYSAATPGAYTTSG